MKKLLTVCVISLLFSCSKESAEELECTINNISYVDINNADDEPYEMYIDDVFIDVIGDSYYLEDYEISAGYHKFTFVEVTAIIPNVDIFEQTFPVCGHASIVFGENDPLK
tara:strand:- start:152 stop:484 length:333 start_codon:yes stop_codon:yes gene_type:complete